MLGTMQLMSAWRSERRCHKARRSVGETLGDPIAAACSARWFQSSETGKPVAKN